MALGTSKMVGSDILGENLAPGAVREVWVRFPRLLGDVVFTLPFLGTLQAHWNAVAEAKGAALRWVAVGHASGAALFGEAKEGFIARTLIEKGGEGKPEPLALRKAWREHPPVAVINLSQSVRLALAARLANIPIRAGIADNRLRLLYTHSFKYRDLPIHLVKRFAPLLESLTGSPRLQWLPIRPDLFGGEGGFEILRKAGWDGRPFVCLAFGSKGASKRWLPEAETWPDLARRLVAQGLAVVWLGGRDEVAQGAELAALAPGSLDLCGLTTIPQAAALLAGAYGNVAIDTGLAHAGAATGSPLVCVNVHGFEWQMTPQGPFVATVRPAEMAMDAAEPDRDWELRSDRIRPGRVLNLLHALAAEAAGAALPPRRS